jgi:hypothetical protein
VSPGSAATRVAAATRWRLATTAVSLRLVPPALVLVVLLLGVLTQRRQAPGSVVATDAVLLFGLAVWIGLATAAALSPGHRAITQVTVGLTPAFAGELLAGTVLVAATGAILVVWPVALRAFEPQPGLSVLAGGYVAVCAAGLAGLAVAAVVDALGVRAPARVLLAAAMVSLALARPALAERHAVLSAISVVATPAVLDLARAANSTEPPGGAAAPAACAVWAAGALLVAWWLRRRRAPVD